MQRFHIKMTLERQWRWLLLGCLSVSYLLVFMQRTGPGVISNSIQGEFHVSAAVLGSITSIQYLLYMVMQIPIGVYGDKSGPEPMLVLGVLLDGVGTLVFSSVHTFGWLLVGRAIVGLGDSFIWINIVLILAKWFGKGRFAAVLGIVNTAGNTGAIITSIPLAAWIAVAGWHIPFIILGLLLVAVSVVDFFVVMRPFAGRETLTEPDSTLVIHKVPLARMLSEVVRDRLAWSTFFCHFGAMGTYLSMVSLWVVPYFMAVYQLSRGHAAWFTLIGFVGSLIASPVVGWLSDRLQNRKGPYLVTQSLGFLAWLTVVLCGGRPPVALAGVVMFVVGFGSGSSLLTFAVIRDLVSPQRSGVTSGFANTGGFLSAVLLPILFGAVFDGFGGAAGGTEIVRHAYGMAFVLPTLFSSLGIMGSLLLPTKSASR